MTNEQVEAAVNGSGHVVVRAADPDAVAEQTAERLGAELVFSVEELEAAIAERLAAIARRNSAREALRLHEAATDPAAHAHVEVVDIAGLRRLAARLDAAHHLVGATRSDMRDRVGEATGLAVHPDTIRSAAAEVTNARVAAARAEAEAEAAEQQWRDGLGSFGPDEDLAGIDQFASDDAAEDGDWEGTTRRSILGVGLMVVGALFIAVALSAAGLGPVGFVLPVLAVGYAVYTLLKNRDEAEDRGMASENLATVSAMTSQAYGGAVEPSPPPAVHELRMQHEAALDRLRYAENAWRGLVGPGVGVDDLDDVLRSRDPRTRVDDVEVENTPAVRTARRHVRRLEAQWKVAWWVLDRPVPSREEASVAIDALVAEGIDPIVALTHEGRATCRAAQEQAEESLGERSLDELRTEAELTPSSVVAVDAEGRLSADDLLERAASLGGDARVVVVAPAGE